MKHFIRGLMIKEITIKRDSIKCRLCHILPQPSDARISKNSKKYRFMRMKAEISTLRKSYFGDLR